MTKLISLCTGRVSRWIVIALWLIVGMGLGSLQPKLQEKTKNDPITYLPGDSEAASVLRMTRDHFDSGAVTPTLVLMTRKDGAKLDVADQQLITSAMTAVETRRKSDKDFTKSRELVQPYSPAGRAQGFVAVDGKAAFGVLPLTGQDANTEIIPAVADTRDELNAQLKGTNLRAYVTGPGGISADAVEVFQSIDVPLLLATVVLVLVLLVVTYRSPVIWVIPLMSVFLAYSIAAGIVYMLVSNDVTTVNGQTTAILIVLMFGAGTDYCLLMVSRLREELGNHEHPRDAVNAAAASTSGAILSSGATVVAAMCMLALAKLDSTATMGPVLGLGVAVSMLAAFTLLPALLSVGGRWAFWPRVPRAETHDEDALGRWGAVGRFVQRSPLRALAIGLLILGAFTLGNLVTPASLGFGDSDVFSKPTDSSRGFGVLKRHYPAGNLAQGTVLVHLKRAASDDAPDPAVDAVATALRASKHVETVLYDPAHPTLSRDRKVVQLALVPKGDPFTDASEDAVPKLRRIADSAARDHGARAEIGGPTAQITDTNTAVDRDQRVIIPVVLILIFLILAMLVRALVAPIHLIVSVVLSFFATLGFTTWLFMNVLDHPGMDRGYPTYLFIFVVALGVDYNIFLVHRIREETRKRGTVEGTVYAVARTGGVITSAGLILAGTFLVLGGLPVYSVKHIGFGVALGVLFDTFIVRSFLVPAMMMLLGDRNWWPGRRPEVAELSQSAQDS